VPTPYPKEFRADVVAVVRQGEKSRAQVAQSFGVSESCLARWLRIADRDDGAAATSTEAAGGSSLEVENCGLLGGPSSRSRRVGSCAGRRPTSLATPFQDDVPLAPTWRRTGFPWR
jgi:transposase